MPSLTRGATTERTLYWRVNRPPDLKQRAVRQGDYKFVEDGGLRFLFDVRTDPGERHDLAERDPARVPAMRALVAAWEQDVDARQAAKEFVGSRRQEHLVGRVSRLALVAVAEPEEKCRTPPRRPAAPRSRPGRGRNPRRGSGSGTG